MNYYNNTSRVPINPDQFKQIAPNLSQDFLNQIIQNARQQGISEQDIQNGLNFIKNIK